MNFTETYKAAGMSDEQIVMLRCIMNSLNPDLYDDLGRKGRLLTMCDVKDKSIYDVIKSKYQKAYDSVLQLLAEFRQPNGTTAIGPGEALMVMFMDGARFAGHREDSDIVIGDKHVELKGQMCRIAGQKFRYDSQKAYDYTKQFAWRFYQTHLTNQRPNQSIQGMCEMTELLVDGDLETAQDYLFGIAGIIWPEAPVDAKEHWVRNTYQRLLATPREEIVSDPRMVGRGKKRHFDPDHTRIKKIVTSKSVAPVYIQCQGELCFARYACEEGFDYLATFDKATGQVRFIDTDGLTLFNVQEVLAGHIEFTRGIGIGNQDNGPQAKIL
jgi:hypothetical protein